MGVVRDVPHNGVEEKSGNPIVYQVIQQGARPGWAHPVPAQRASRERDSCRRCARSSARSIRRSFLYDVGTLDQAVGSSFDNRRAVMLLLTAFAGLALFLSSLGIYGVLAYDVSQRTREIGIRSAIGASGGQIIGMVLKQGLWKTGLGIVIGLVGAFFLSRSMTSLLFGVTPTEPVVYVVVSAVLIAVALLASYLPARRASKINPSRRPARRVKLPSIHRASGTRS